MQTDLYITRYAHDKMVAYARAASGEISGFGMVKGDQARLTIYDVDIMPQATSAGHATIEPGTYAAYVMQLIKAKRPLEHAYLWWHSHNDFAPFFSGTDTGTIETSSEFPLLVSVVTNKAAQFVQRLDIYKPIRATAAPENLFFDKDKRQFSEREAEAVKREVTDKVKNTSCTWNYASPLSGLAKWSKGKDKQSQSPLGFDYDDGIYTPSHSMTESEWLAVGQGGKPLCEYCYAKLGTKKIGQFWYCAECYNYIDL